MDSQIKISLEQLNNYYILFRHGQSKANVAKIVVSHPENGIPSTRVGSSLSEVESGWGLTELGKEQVKNASHNLVNYLNNNFLTTENIKILVKIFSSPFIRTVETSNILLYELSSLINNDNITIHPQVITHNDLRERNFGIFELKPDHDSYSKVWKMDESKISLDEYNVESCEQVRSRMCKVIKEIEQQNHIMAILVSHGDSLQILQTAFENIDSNLHRSLNHLGVSEWRIFSR